MAKTPSTEQQLLDDLRSGGKVAEQALAEVYRSNRPMVMQWVQRNSGTEAEAKDVFQEAMIRFFENVRASRFKGESLVSTYLYSIARFVWLNRLKRRQIEQKITADYPEEPTATPFMERFLEAEEEAEIFALFNHLGENCKQLLIASIYYQYSMEEICTQLNYSSNQVARNQKYRCLQKLRALLQSQPHLWPFLSNKK